MAAVPLPYVLLLNNDVELAPDYLEKLLLELEAGATLGFATGKLLRGTDHALLDGTALGWRNSAHLVTLSCESA